MAMRRSHSGIVERKKRGLPPGSPRPEAMEDGVFRWLYHLCPSVAQAETRTLTLLRSTAGVPPGEYGFVEAFCSGAACDCRRVMLFVMRRDQGQAAPEHVATLGFGWEPLSFYRKWMRGDVDLARDAKGPCVEPNGPPCAYGRALLELFSETCLSDERYVERVARHYAMFKQRLRHGMLER